MDNLRRKQTEYLLTEYNRELASVYDKILDSVTNEAVFADAQFQAQLQNDVFNSLQPWYEKPLEGLAEGTPEAFFDSILSLDEAMEVFTVAARMVDGDLPDQLMLRVGAFGEEAIDRLTTLSLASSWQKQEGITDEVFRDGLAVDMAALHVLGQWTVPASIDPVLDRFCSLDLPDEFVADGVKSYLLAYGEDAISPIIARLDSARIPGLSGPYEYLVIALTELGRAEPKEEVYQCLRRVFRAMEHKVIASICLGDYGDGRAVPLLKSYLDRHVHDVDRQFFYETISAIRRLGGDIRDIEDPFRDFSQRKG